jgi:hypothetical protein
MIRYLSYLLALSIIIVSCNQVEKQADSEIYTGPIIDMHIHADQLENMGPDPLGLCLPLSTIVPHYDPTEPWMEAWIQNLVNPDCDDPIWSPQSDQELFERYTQQLNEYNVTAYTSGSLELVKKWRNELPNRIKATIQLQIGRDDLTPDSIRSLVLKHDFKILGEIANQYVGIAPDDPRMGEFYQVAEELDIPVAIHMGSGSPGAPRFLSPEYSVELSNPLLLEPVLKKYPRLRVSIMHYGEPFIDELIAMMYHYPQIYIDLGGIQWCYPEEYFYENHLKPLVNAGFGQRIMFGSDAFLWPELIERSVDIINGAEFLSYEQKSDIFYNNASRFLRLEH